MTSVNSKKRGVMLILAVISIVISLSSIAFAQNVVPLQITVEEITPNPIEPGQDATIRLRVYNSGDTIVTGVDAKLDAITPFSSKTNVKDITSDTIFCSRCSKSATYYITVDPNANEGIYPLNFELKQKNILIKETINIKVEGIPDIIFSSEEFLGETKPNGVFDLKLRLKNVGTGISRNIKISPNSNDFIIAGNSEVFIDQLNPAEEKEISFKFNTKSEIAPDSYLIPIGINFLDQRGRKYNTTNNVGIKVINEAQITIQNFKVDTRTQGEVRLQFKVENIGQGDAKDVEVELVSSLDGAKKNFLGKLEKDEDMPVVFALYGAGISRDMNDKIKITFTDDLGEHSIEKDVNYVLPPNNNFKLIIGAIVISVIILTLTIVLMKKRKQRVNNGYSQ